MDIQLSKLKRWLILLTVSVSVFMATLDGSIVNIALPVISNKLSVSISSIQWVVTSYLLTISMLLLIWGKISDMYGKKSIFIFGFIVFTLGSGLCGLSQSLEMLVFSRILQALGASATMALSQGIVTSTFPANERGRALGITGTTVAIGSLVGPSLGGILVHVAGWQSIFFINIPIGIIGTILAIIIIPRISANPVNTAFDYKGAGLMIASIAFLFLGLLFAQDGTISINLLIPLIVISAILIAIFINNEKKAVNPLINLNLFKSPVFTMGVSAAFLVFVATFATTMFIPFYLQYALKLDTLTAGLLISFYPATSAILSPISGWLSDKISYRPLTIVGLTVSTIALFILATFTTSTSYVEICILMTALGLGTAVFQSPNNSSVMGSVPRDQLGVAGGINALFRNLGMVSGVTLSVMIFTFTTKMNINNLTGTSASVDPTLFIKGFRVVLVFAALSCLAAVAVSVTRSVGVGSEKSSKRINASPKPSED